MIFLALLVMVEGSDKTSAKQFYSNLFLVVPRICLAITAFHFLAWLEGPHEPDIEGRQS